MNISAFTVAFFGEAQKGAFQTGYYCKTLADLSDYLGEPPSHDSKGLHFAIQALLYQRDVLFFRVHEEGFSVQDYLLGLNLLENREHLPEDIPSLSAICLPGVGDSEILKATDSVCAAHQSFLILTEKDLYDYLTEAQRPYSI